MQQIYELTGIEVPPAIDEAEWGIERGLARWADLERRLGPWVSGDNRISSRQVAWANG